MTYQNKFGKYAVKIDGNTIAWFKDYRKALDKYISYAKFDPAELDGDLTLEDIQTGEVLAKVEAEF